MPTTKAMSALAAQKITRPGLHPAGDNLYLQVSASGAKSWICRYRA